MGEGRGKGVQQSKRDADEEDKVEVASGVTVASLRRFRAALIGLTQRLPMRCRLRRQRSLRTLTLIIKESIVLSSTVHVMTLGANARWLRSGGGIGWLAAGDKPSLSVLFSRRSFVDVPLIFSWPADHVLD